jgi:hypothetical protein
MVQYIQPEPSEIFLAILPFLAILVGAHIVFAINILITQNYLGSEKANFYQLALKRYFPTIVTLILTTIIILMGTVLLIVPGIIMSLRLFWADEFALMHNKNPFEAIKANYKLTADNAGLIFGFQFLQGLINYLPLIIMFLTFFAFSFLESILPLEIFVALSASLTTIFAVLWFTFFHSAEVVIFYGLRAHKNK